MMRYRMFIATMLIFICSFVSEARASEEHRPFRPGEKLRFVLKWTFIKAGEATLEVLPFETVNGVRSYHFVLTAKSTSFLDKFYKVRDRIDAYANEKMSRSVFFKKHQEEGKTHRDVEVHFNWLTREVQYSNFGKKKDPVPLLPGAFDPLSAFYFCRFFDLDQHQIVERPITDGKKCVMGRLKVVGKEKIRLSVGTYDSFVLEPELRHVGGVFEKSRDAKIRLWVSADKHRIPLRIRSKVVVGSFVGELVSAEGL